MTASPSPDPLLHGMIALALDAGLWAFDHRRHEYNDARSPGDRTGDPGSDDGSPGRSGH